jgi:polar amino acid transport system substrate-binding protein
MHISIRRFATVVLLTASAAMAFSSPSAAQPAAVRVGVSATPPTGGIPPAGGYFFDLMTEAAKRAGITVEFSTMPLGDLLNALAANTIDVAAGGQSLTPANAALNLAFSGPVVVSTGGIIVPATDNGTYAALTDLRGKTVGATANTAYASQLRDAGVADVREYPNFAGAMEALGRGEIAAYYTNPTVFAFQHDVQGLHPGARLVDTFVNTYNAPGGVAVRAVDSSLLASLTATFAAMKADGTMATIATRWHVTIPQ